MPSNHCLLSNQGTARSLMKKPCFWLNLTCFAHGWMSQQLKESNKNSSAYFKAKKQLYKFLCQIFWVDLLIVRNNCMFPNKNANGWGNVGAFNWYLLHVHVWISLWMSWLSLGGIEHPALLHGFHHSRSAMKTWTFCWSASLDQAWRVQCVACWRRLENIKKKAF